MDINIVFNVDEARALYSVIKNSENPHLVVLSGMLKGELNRLWNPAHDQEAECECGHSYYRHFDSYDGMEPVGCKYCECWTFKE